MNKRGAYLMSGNKPRDRSCAFGEVLYLHSYMKRTTDDDNKVTPITTIVYQAGDNVQDQQSPACGKVHPKNNQEPSVSR